MYWTVLKVLPLENYRLLITFENKEERIFDVTPYLEIEIFKELKDVNLFNRAKVSFDTVEWENEADFDPEFLYENSEINNISKVG